MWPSSARRTPSPWKGANRHFLEWLETFRAVVSTGHFTAAAVELGYSQSTVTAHIKSLERQLGVTLFERCQFSKNIILTDAGRNSLEYARRLLSLADETKTAVGGFSKEAGLASSR